MNRGVRLLLFPLIGLVAFLLGLFGYSLAYPAESWPGQFDNVWRSISLFLPASGPDIDGPDNNYLAIARVLAPLATIGAAYELARTRLIALWNSLVISLRRGHTVIIGHGYRGRSFLHSCRHDDQVVVIDSTDLGDQAGDAGVNGAPVAKVRYLIDDGRNPAVLEAAQARHASRVLILTGSDAVNLEILQQIKQVQNSGEGLVDRLVTWLWHLRTRRSGIRPEEANVIVRVDSRSLVRQLDRDDAFFGYLGATATHVLTVMPFSYARTAAMLFLAEHPLVDLAALRGQGRVHVVCIGWTSFMFEFLEQLARLSPFRDFDRPRVSLFVRHPKDVESEINAVQPALLSDAPHSVIDLAFFDLDGDSCIPSADQMRTIEPDGSATVTATVVSLGGDHQTVAVALAVRERSMIRDRWKGPIFAHLSVDSALPDLLQRKASTPDLAARLVPVGMIQHACRLDAVTGAREKMARSFHDEYLSARGIPTNTPRERRGDNAMPWDRLKQTYRIANRRAIDHLPIKLLDAGYIIKDVPRQEWRTSEADKLGADTGELGHLAELEHQSWEIDRWLDGWQEGDVRDDEHRINPTLGVPFERLTPEVQERDRQPVRALADLLGKGSGKPTVLRDIRIGLIGHNQVATEDKTRILQQLDEQLPSLLETWRERHVSLVTPLAPGSDTILAEYFLDRLSAAKIEHRMLVLRSLPRSAVFDDFAGSDVPDNEWGLRERPDPDPEQTVPQQLQAYMEDAFDAASDRTLIVDISEAGHTLEDWTEDQDMRRNAYRKANALIVQTCDVLIAYCRETQEQRPGGTVEALLWAVGGAQLPDTLRAVGPKKNLPKVVMTS